MFLHVERAKSYAYLGLFVLQSNWFLTSYSFYACPSESMHGYLHPLLIFSFFSAAQLS